MQDLRLHPVEGDLKDISGISGAFPDPITYTLSWWVDKGKGQSNGRVATTQQRTVDAYLRHASVLSCPVSALADYMQLRNKLFLDAWSSLEELHGFVSQALWLTTTGQGAVLNV